MGKPFSSNSIYLLILRKITNSVTKITIFPHGGKSEILFLAYVLYLIDLLEQKFYRDSNLRIKLMHESVKKDVLILLLPMLWCIVFLYYWIHLNTSLIHTRLHFNASFDKYSRLDEEMIIKTSFFPHPKGSQTHFFGKNTINIFFTCL